MLASVNIRRMRIVGAVVIVVCGGGSVRGSDSSRTNDDDDDDDGGGGGGGCRGDDGGTPDECRLLVVIIFCVRQPLLILYAPSISNFARNSGICFSVVHPRFTQGNPRHAEGSLFMACT